MTVFEYGDKQLPLSFTLGAWEQMEKDVCPLDELFEMYKSSNTSKRMSAHTMRKTLMIAVIFAKAAGCDVTFDELHEALTPGQTIVLQGTIMAAVSDGLDFDAKKTGERDLVLEELDAEEGKNA